uniref:Phosphoribulokinase/uridine kinase domain-containing protein n=1 Tax=Fibrocapsa japonica TaxID=94617 RepID=A0A7S2V868_9STRA|mmetsp:Transcript_896/g.1286  ORF Transcript_896/g.1286 Transcript_896/m.1286 type:complete len:285 (+) Transcript_896:120-974(+)
MDTILNPEQLDNFLEYTSGIPRSLQDSDGATSLVSDSSCDDDPPPPDVSMYGIYDELAAHLVDKVLEVEDGGNSCTTGQIWVGVAGPPGSGKTTLTGEVCKRVVASGVGCIVVPMDGFHLSRAQLGQMDNPKEAFSRRGAPFTFDPKGLLERLREARQIGCGLFPSFDHAVGDPVQDDIEVTRKHRIVIVEGNYLLLDGFDVWKEMPSCFDETWVVKCDVQKIRERIIERHISTGDSLENAVRRADHNDLLNAKLVLDNFCVSHRIIHSDSCEIYDNKCARNIL